MVLNPTTKEALRREIKALLSEQRLGVLSTHYEGQPYASLVAFVASSDLGNLFFATPRATRKYRNLSHDDRASFLIDNRQNLPTGTISNP